MQFFRLARFFFLSLYAVTVLLFPVRAETSSEVALKEGDRIRLEVFNQDSLTKSTTVSRSGYVTFPLIGALKAAGRSTSDLAKEVKTLLEKDYIRSANVTIVVEEYNKEKTSYVTVLGEVQKPGAIPMPEGKDKVDLLTAIANAGGFSEIANPKRVTVKREVEGQEPKVFTLNADAMQKNADGKFYLQHGDTVSVPKRLF